MRAIAIDKWPFPREKWDLLGACMKIGFFLVAIHELLLSPITPSHRIIQINNILPPHGSLLSPLLIARPVESAGHRKVRHFISNHFKDLGWHVELDVFNKNTTIGLVTFTNIIATANPDAHQRIIVAAHYDSKRFVLEHGTQGKRVTDFVGASDSAWPCALMLELASSVPLQNAAVSLQMIFFDGEEALEHWSEADSIYGAKHLADRWLKAGRLDGIKFLLLLDLLGTINPEFHNFFPETYHLFRQLMAAEQKLIRISSLKNRQRYFVDRNVRVQMDNGKYWLEDDHIPFLEAGVPVLHLIPLPFPKQWHTPQDDVSALDADTCHDLGLIIHSFLSSELKAP